ncbi:hypothetical protein HK101_011415 [Irineochytrium annulatum]|nr:hypothetical protein HK101_011415 [Irineochytrium annulatum]
MRFEGVPLTLISGGGSLRPPATGATPRANLAHANSAINLDRVNGAPAPRPRRDSSFFNYDGGIKVSDLHPLRLFNPPPAGGAAHAREFIVHVGRGGGRDDEERVPAAGNEYTSLLKRDMERQNAKDAHRRQPKDALSGTLPPVASQLARGTITQQPQQPGPLPSRVPHLAPIQFSNAGVVRSRPKGHSHVHGDGAASHHHDPGAGSPTRRDLITPSPLHQAHHAHAHGDVVNHPSSSGLARDGATAAWLGVHGIRGRGAIRPGEVGRGPGDAFDRAGGVGVGVPARVEQWVKKGRYGGVSGDAIACGWTVGGGEQTWMKGAGYGGRILKNVLQEDPRVMLLLSNQDWDGGAAVRKARDGSLVYSVTQKHVAGHRSLFLRDGDGRKLWKITERFGWSGFNYDVHHLQPASPVPDNSSLAAFSKPGRWRLVGTMDRVSPCSLTGPATSVFGGPSQRGVQQNVGHVIERAGAGRDIPPAGSGGSKSVGGLGVGNCGVGPSGGRAGGVGVGGILGQASSTGCAGGSRAQGFSRLELRCGGRCIVMMGDPVTKTYRFLDHKTSRHLGSLLKQPHTRSGRGPQDPDTAPKSAAPAAERSSSRSGVKTPRDPLPPSWELVVEPLESSFQETDVVGGHRHHGDNASTKDHAHGPGVSVSRCGVVTRTFPPEMILAAALVAKLLMDVDPTAAAPGCVTPNSRSTTAANGAGANGRGHSLMEDDDNAISRKALQTRERRVKMRKRREEDRCRRKAAQRYQEGVVTPPGADGLEFAKSFGGMITNESGDLVKGT